MKFDPYYHKERYQKWRESVNEGIPHMNKYNSDLVLKYLDDMEHGLNVAQGHAKGGRSYIRLNTLREKMKFYTTRFKERFDIEKITDITEDQICRFYSEMRKGIIKRNDGKAYKSTAYSVKCFKAFWHWWMKINRKKGISIPDITVDLDVREDKPRWVYLSEEQVKTFCENSTFDYKVLITFLFDTGIRAPTELMNIRVSDFYNDCKELMIRDEISKTFGRRIKLMLSSELIGEYIKAKELSGNDFLFRKKPDSMNKYLRRNAKRLFGDKESLAGYHIIIKKLGKIGEPPFWWLNPDWLFRSLQKMKKVNPKTKFDRLMLEHVDYVENITKKLRKSFGYTKNSLLCHCDLSRDNILWKEGKLVAILDFDNCTYRPRIFDVSYAIMHFCNKFPGLDKRRVDVFLKEYTKKIKLTQEEIKQLVPMMLRHQALIFEWFYQGMDKSKDKGYRYMQWGVNMMKSLEKYRIK